MATRNSTAEITSQEVNVESKKEPLKHLLHRVFTEHGLLELDYGDLHIPDRLPYGADPVNFADGSWFVWPCPNCKTAFPDAEMQLMHVKEVHTRKLPEELKLFLPIPASQDSIDILLKRFEEAQSRCEDEDVSQILHKIHGALLSLSHFGCLAEDNATCLRYELLRQPEDLGFFKSCSFLGILKELSEASSKGFIFTDVGYVTDALADDILSSEEDEIFPLVASTPSLLSFDLKKIPGNAEGIDVDSTLQWIYGESKETREAVLKRYQSVLEQRTSRIVNMLNKEFETLSGLLSFKLEITAYKEGLDFVEDLLKKAGDANREAGNYKCYDCVLREWNGNGKYIAQVISDILEARDTYKACEYWTYVKFSSVKLDYQKLVSSLVKDDYCILMVLKKLRREWYNKIASCDVQILQNLARNKQLEAKLGPYSVCDCRPFIVALVKDFLTSKVDEVGNLPMKKASSTCKQKKS